MGPPGCLVYSGDLTQYHIPQEILKLIFEGKSNVPPAVLKPVKRACSFIQYSKVYGSWIRLGSGQGCHKILLPELF